MREILAHLQFRGIIRERSVDPFIRLLRAVRDRRRIRGVLLDVSSGGGAAVPSMDLYLAVKRLDQVKPVIASIGSIGASGGYMAALGARRIYAYPDSNIGSIGVIYPHFAVKGLLDKLGIEVDLIHQGRHKDAYQGYRPLTDEERGKLLKVSEDGYRGFVELVARERHKTVDEITPLATGEVWSGTQAARLGLVDVLGDREMALTELSQITGVPSHKVARIEPPQPFLARLLSGGFMAAGNTIRTSVADSIEELAYEGFLGGRR
ncbi:MAG TPA: signal peptide peptidase SppA [Thermoplasmata archaeon]|nr:signal peptide peptidase SppA [Thermoplasmata archaeon]